jgi:hypothetical protein
MLTGKLHIITKMTGSSLHIMFGRVRRKSRAENQSSTSRLFYLP